VKVWAYIVFITVISPIFGVNSLIKRFAVVAQFGEQLPLHRVICWGRYASESFFWLKLGSYSWQRQCTDYGHNRDYCWHVKMLMWNQGDGWKIFDEPIRR
jgi:hypothetical protein